MPVMDALSPRFSNALITALALICTYILAFYWNLERPYWAGFTVFMVSLPTIGQSLLKGLLRIAGTFLGAAAALVLYGLLHQQRLGLLAALSLYLCVCVRLARNNQAYGYFYFISSVVTAIIVLMAVQGTDSIFHLAIYRTEETVLGIAVYSLCSALFSGRQAVSDLPAQVDKLWKQHRALLALSREKTDVGHIHAVYAELAEVAQAAAVLLPSAQLENYRIWKNRRQWTELFARSAELARLQRHWASLSVTLRNRETGTPVRFAERTAQLEAALSEKNMPEGRKTAKNAGEHLADSKPDPGSGEPAQDPLFPPTDRVLEITQGGLFQRQLALTRRMRELTAFLLYGGPAPSPAHLPPARADKLNPAEIARSVKQTFFTFWLVVPIWVLLHPPGPDNVVFLMLAVLLGLSVMLANTVNPVRLFLIYCQGALIAAVLYLLVYPHLARLELFLGLLFVTSFLITYVFHTPAQTLAKLAYLMPWLSTTDFTNFPKYTAMPYISSSLTLLMGVGLVCLLQYLFFSGNSPAQFLSRQNAFFHTVADILEQLDSPSALRPSFPLRLRLYRNRLRVHRLAAQLTDLSERLDPRFLTPGLAGHLALGLGDIARSIDRLALLASELPAQTQLSSGQTDGQAAGQTPAQSEHRHAETFPAFDLEIARAAKSSAVLKRAVLQRLAATDTSDTEQPGKHSAGTAAIADESLFQESVLGRAAALIGRIDADVAEYRDVARSANWKLAYENRF